MQIQAKMNRVVLFKCLNLAEYIFKWKRDECTNTQTAAAAKYKKAKNTRKRNHSISGRKREKQHHTLLKGLHQVSNSEET